MPLWRYDDWNDRWYEVPDDEDYAEDLPSPTDQDLDEVVDKMMTNPGYHDSIVGWF